MRVIRVSALSAIFVLLLLLSGCDVLDMILADMMRDILSKLNPFAHLFSGSGTTAIPPSSAQAVGTAVLTTALVIAWALSNGAFRGLIDLIAGTRPGTSSTSGPALGGGASTEAGLKNAAELWDKLTRGGAEADRLAQSMLDQKLANLAAGSLPETVDIVGSPPTWHEINETLKGVRDRGSGSESPDDWINISQLLDKGTTVRSGIVGLLTMVGVSFTTATAPWIIAAGVSAGLIDKYMPDSLNILEMFFEPGQPDSGTPEPTGPVFEPVAPEEFPQLKKEDLWKMPRDERIEMWQDSRDWIQKLGGSDPPTTVEEWERRYESANRSVNEYEELGKEDPNYLDSNNYKKWRYQRDLLDTLRASGPRMELR